MRITKAAAIAAGTVALALGAVACNDEVPGNSANPPASAAAPAASHPAAATSPAGGGTGGSSAKPSAHPSQAGTAKPAGSGNRCRTDELKAEIQIEPPIGNYSSAMLKLANVGKRSCDLSGYAGLGGLLADDSKVPVTTNRVPLPLPPGAPTMIAPGDNAFAGLKWSPCDKADASCEVLAGLEVTPPDETTQLIAQLDGLDNKQVIQLTVSHAGITIGTLQPTVGVLFNS